MKQTVCVFFCFFIYHVAELPAAVLSTKGCVPRTVVHPAHQVALALAVVVAVALALPAEAPGQIGAAVVLTAVVLVVAELPAAVPPGLPGAAAGPADQAALAVGVGGARALALQARSVVGTAGVLVTFRGQEPVMKLVQPGEFSSTYSDARLTWLIGKSKIEHLKIGTIFIPVPSIQLPLDSIMSNLLEQI